MKADVGDMLVDIDYALARIRVMHRDMELADAIYMIGKHNEQLTMNNE